MKNGDVVYAVSFGAYEDNHVEAVFATREEAEAYAAWYNGPDPDHGPYCDGAEVQEFTLGAKRPEDTGAFRAVGSALQEDPLVEWDRREEPSGVSVTTDPIRNAPWICVYAATVDEARSEWHEAQRAVKAGTLVPDEEAG